MRAADDHLGACVLAAAEVYVGLTAERADRPPLSPDDAAAELHRLESAGILEPRASRAARWLPGTASRRRATGKRQQNPGGLTRREVEVLRLAARGLTTHDIAGRLYISPKTADHHIQHIDGKIRRVDAGRGGSLGDAVSPVRTDSSPRALQVIRCDVLGGLIHEYEIAAEA